jgi:predicted phage baseplate assembly protein
MRLPEIVLDDRRFQDLVNEARLRINQKCPEWTEHNVSDPGITLIELFAWMTETIIFRLNRIPDKLHVALLELLGIQMEPPTAATTDLQFRLADVADEPIEIPGQTEVGTLRTLSEEAIVFQTDESFTIPAARPIAYAVERGKQIKDVGVAKGVAKPKGPDQLAFGTPPQVGDALYVGFDTSLHRLLMQVDVDCSQARGAGVDPEDPPLRWEVSDGEGWTEAEVLEDRTGGFNYGSGIVELQLPVDHSQVPIAGKRAYWLRCRYSDRTRSGGDPTTYTHPPEIYSITAAPIGALIPGSHAQHAPDEIIGESDGTPGQEFTLRQSPMLQPLPHETLEVVNVDSGQWEKWEEVPSFVESGPDDKHFVLDEAHSAIELGPAVRMPDGSWSYHGAVPPSGARLRFSSYRHGGGRAGNVAPDALTVMKSALPGVATVRNPKPALGGVDAESLDSARSRAALEIRTRYRAVTADDFVFLAGEASPRVARAICIAPDGTPEGTARLHILPRVEPADRKLSLVELTPDETLLSRVASYMDEKRLIGTRIEIVPVKVRGVSVVVNLQAAPRADIARVEEDVAYALYTYLNPLVGGSVEGPGVGWEFGRALNQGELFGIVHSIEGVEFVKILRVYETDLATGKQDSKPAGTHIVLESDELIASGNHIVKAEHPEF